MGPINGLPVRFWPNSSDSRQNAVFRSSPQNGLAGNIYLGCVAGKTGDVSDPGDEIFGIIICAVSAVPVKPGIHIFVPLLQA